MKRINLYFDFEFTSLSPDAQIISLGIVSDETGFRFPIPEPKTVSMENRIPECESFYAEFNDFDINRCDDWVKENVVGKLKYIKDTLHIYEDDNNGNVSCVGKTEHIKDWVKDYIAQFSDYEIQFVCDCGTFDWYHLVQLIGEWEEIPTHISVDVNSIPCYMTLEDVCKMHKESPVVFHQNIPSIPIYNGGKIGLPKLPPNISPVPFDLNDIIAIKKGISPKEAFDLNREELASCLIDVSEQTEFWGKSGKHNSLWDAKVIKAIYNKLV